MQEFAVLARKMEHEKLRRNPGHLKVSALLPAGRDDQVKCWGCGKVGHRAQQCSNIDKVPGTDGQLRDRFYCRKCNCRGHLGKLCPSVDSTTTDSSMDASSGLAKNGIAPHLGPKVGGAVPP